MHDFRKLSVLLCALLLAACSETQQNTEAESEQEAVELTDSLVDASTIIEADPGGWVTHGGTYSEQRHSPLQKVNKENVADLGLQWSYDLGTSRGIEATPIVHDGIMYVTSTWNIVHALDARSGAKIWSYDPAVDKEQAAYGCCDAVNRGVAIWGDSVFTGTLDGRLISLNAKNGAVNWDVNTIDKSQPYTITGAPRIVDGKVFIGNGGAELGVRGYMSAYSVADGALLWRFHTVPGNPADGFESDAMKMAAETWDGEWWNVGGGGGTVWDSMAYDPELDLLYIGVGNGSPWNQKIRSPGGGDNLFLSSIVALRPDTGEYVWHYQTTPGETWDYTATQHMILADIEIDGADRQVIMQAPKNGFFYVIDRATGELISANNFVPVNWATHVDMETGRPVETDGARYGPGKEPMVQLPGPLGAHNWHPMSYSPQTGLVYIPAQEAPWVYGDKKDFAYTPGAWNTGTDFIYAVLPTERGMFAALKSMAKGRLLAWDPVAQKPAWSFEHGGPWNGGVLSTAGGLVFQGTADAHLAAYDAASGERLWRFFTETGVVAAPITYELDGEQYVAVASGWGGSFVLGFGGVLPSGSAVNVGRVLVFKVGGQAELPQTELKDEPLPTKPAMIEVDEETLALGANAYANTCVGCHGDQAFSSGLVPNLRFSSYTTNAEAWKTVLLEGALAKRGMPNFGSVLDEATAEAIRAFVIAEANSERDEAFYKSFD
ncbi:MAG: PQQ-dependent dehydrogenase, methanol/ethanol family [Gammaproteobacteria bacterium]|nr:PQQ-dependent dehydrogenase, methanol/ethanol family [Gammaproteobacteria bacterium]